MPRTPVQSLILLVCLGSPVWGADFPADRLRIVAKIDGTDDLHISPQKAWWKHKTASPPTDVQINDSQWDVRQSADFALPPETTLIRPDLELCGAVLHKLRGRGSVKLGFDGDGLVMHFDDSEAGGADTYEVTIDFAQVLARKPAGSKKERDFLPIKWWFNTGAVAGNYSVTMPISTYLGSRDWFSHPWAIAHEMLHNFGYGHTHEMNRLDRDIQERMEQFRWFVADHPEYMPE